MEIQPRLRRLGGSLRHAGLRLAKALDVDV